MEKPPVKEAALAGRIGNTEQVEMKAALPGH